jgi:hypothetical protein
MVDKGAISLAMRADGGAAGNGNDGAWLTPFAIDFEEGLLRCT